MITKLNTYEGVPVGGTNFEDFLSYVRAFLGANFGFSTNVLDNDGGYFSSDNFTYVSRDAVNPADSAFFFVPTGQDVGSLFGKKGIEYYRFEVQEAGVLDPQAQLWTLLATKSESPDLDKLVFTNTSEENKLLPYRPLRKNEDDNYLEGYLDVRLNGTPQIGEADYSVSFTNVSNFMEQTLQFNKIRLGAEFPKPILDGRYDNTFLDPEVGISRNTLESVYDSKMSFEFTNFSTEFGGHILLWRRVGLVNYFSYVSQDLGSDGPIPSGKYRVLDYSRGIIELNISADQLNMLRHPGDGPDAAADIPFIVVSAEQLLEDTSGGVTSHISRYGEVYDGSSTDALLAEYIFDGSSNIVREIPDTLYSSSLGKVLLEDVNQSFTDGIILAIEYYGIPNVDVISEVQKNRYKPDTFQLYYNTGIVLPTAPGTSNIRAFVEINPSSWYNRDILSAEYFPVNRTEETYYSLITTDEAVNFDIVFDPNQDFTIVDTIGLGDLNDVDFGSFSAGDVIYYNGAEFEGREFVLEELLNVQSGTPADLSVLQYFDSTSTWTRRSVTQALVSEPISSPVSYAPSVSISDANHLVDKGYVDALAVGVDGDITTHANAITTDPSNTLFGNAVHGATEYAIAGRIIRRQASSEPQPGVADVTTPSNTITVSSSENIVNINWILQNSSRSTTSSARSNRLARYDANGKLFASNPVSGDSDFTVATKSYVDNAVSGATSFSPTIDSVNAQYRSGSSDTLLVNLTYPSSITTLHHYFHHLYDNVGIYTFTINAAATLPSTFTVRMTPRYRLDTVLGFQGNVVNNGFPGAGNSSGYLLNNAATSFVMYGGYVPGLITNNNTSRNLFIGCRKQTSEYVRFSIQIIATFV